MKTYNKIIRNLNRILLKNRENYEATRDIFNKNPNETVAKFNNLIEKIDSDITNNRTSDNINFTEHEELNLFTLVLYYRLVRNLISIEYLLEYANTESNHFDCTEYSIGILLRANLLDCKLLYRSRVTSDINKYHLDSFKNFLKKLKKRHKLLTSQAINSEPLETATIDREIEFCKRIIDNLARNSINDTPALDSNKFGQQIAFFDSIEEECTKFYEIYSKYDHFSLYEISKLHWNREKRVEAMHQAILLQVPALTMCFGILGGIELTAENVAALGTWLEEGIAV